jgi:TonB family protein
MAGAELSWLDAHPFPISGAAAGTEVKVLVRLKVSAVKGTADIDVTAPPGALAPASGPEITAPVWVVSPHEDWAGEFVPERAARMGQKGEATVRCVATETGTLASCWVMQETPADFRFGDAVLYLLQLVRMKPHDAAGAPIAGRPFVQTLRYEGFNRSRPYPEFQPAWAR